MSFLETNYMYTVLMIHIIAHSFIVALKCEIALIVHNTSVKFKQNKISKKCLYFEKEFSIMKQIFLTLNFR